MSPAKMQTVPSAKVRQRNNAEEKRLSKRTGEDGF